MQHYAAIWSCPKSHIASGHAVHHFARFVAVGRWLCAVKVPQVQVLILVVSCSLLTSWHCCWRTSRLRVYITMRCWFYHIYYTFFSWPNSSSNVLEIGAGSRQAWRTPAPRPFKVHLKGLCVAKGLWWESRNEWKLRTKHCVNLWTSNNQSCDWSNEKYPWKGRMIQLDSIAIFLSAFAC